MTNLKTTLAGAIPGVLLLIFAATGYATGNLTAESAMAFAATGLGLLGIGAAAKDAGPTPPPAGPMRIT